MENLWPPDIGSADQKAPVTILKEQGAVLREKTQGTVEAKIAATDIAPILGGRQHKFGYDFYLAAPTLMNFTYLLFSITYDLEMYPLKFIAESEIMSEIYITLLSIDDVAVDSARKTVIAESESAFVEVLRCIFNSNKTRRIIKALIAQTGSTG